MALARFFHILGKIIDSDLWVKIVEHQKREKHSDFIWKDELARIRDPNYKVRK